MELAACGRIGRGRNGALQHDAVHLGRGVRHGDGGEQSLGVGVQRILEDVLGSAVFHQVAQIHNAHGVGDMLHHGQIVGDEQIGELILLLQLLQQIDDLRLDGHVQGGHGLIADDELRLQSQGPGDTDALTLAAGELMGIAILVEGLQAAVVHDLIDIVVKFFLGHQTVLADGLTDDLAHGHTGLQRGEGVLEDDLHLGAHVAHLLGVEVIDLLAVEQHLAVGLFAGQTEDGAAGGGLAAAGLAHQTHGGAALEVEGDAVHGLHVTHGLVEHTTLDGEVFLQVLDLEDILRIVLDLLLSGLLDISHSERPPFRSNGSS